jgi:hypothetical protein
MAITRSQIARQLLAEGGAPNPRKPFRSGDLAARDDSYGTLSGGESPASMGGDNEMVFDQRFQDIVTAPETVGFTRGSDASEFIKSNLTKGLGLIAKQPGISTGIDILRSIFPDTGQTYVRGVDRFGTGDEDETNRFRNRIVQPMMPMTPKLPSDIEPQQSDMQEFVQRFTLPERFRLSNGGITGTETAMREARQAYDRYKKSGGTLSFDKFIALGNEGVAKFFAEGGRIGFADGYSVQDDLTDFAQNVGKEANLGGGFAGDNEGPPTTFGGGVTTNVTGFGPGGRPAPEIKTLTPEEIAALIAEEDEDEKNKSKEKDESKQIGLDFAFTGEAPKAIKTFKGIQPLEELGGLTKQQYQLNLLKNMADGGPIRQAYGLGSLVKSITKPVKKVLKSDVGKAALAAAAVYYAPAVFSGTTGFGPGTTYGNFLRGPGKDFLFGKLTSMGPAEKGFAVRQGGLFNFLKSPRGAATAILGTSALAGVLTPKQEEQVESLSSRISDNTGIDVEKIRKEVQAAYASGDLSGLRSKYPFLIPTSAAESGSMAEGGRIGAEEGGLMNLGGNEMDLRGGGFVPIGVAEKADDVPARLSKNEFVFTADAVRAAGGGSVDRGADLMYKTMKQLENQVA